MHNKQIIIFSDSDGQHESKLCKAFGLRGAHCSRISLMDCQLNHSVGSTGLVIPGYERRLPDAVFVRGIPAGSFEQVTFRLAILHALEEAGVVVYNSARTIERTVDKGMTSFLLARAGVASPGTWVCESEDIAREIVNREIAAGEQLVLKPLFGNCGKGLQLISDNAALPALDTVSGVYYLQRYIHSADDRGRDWRVLIIANEAIAAMERIADHWITNRAMGGKCLPAVLTSEIRELAEAASSAIGMAYAGVDIIRNADGQYLVLEVNSVPAWRGLQTVVEKDISQMLADDLLSICEVAGKKSHYVL